MVVKLEIDMENRNTLVLTGPLEEIKKLVLTIKADEGKVANIALDDALLMNDTIYQITKPVYRERDGLRIKVEELKEERQEAIRFGIQMSHLLVNAIMPEDVSSESYHHGKCCNSLCSECYPAPIRCP